MISSYFQSTYNSGKIAQTYLLASKVKAKLTQEAVRNDVDLHKLVCQANLLDNLIENLNYHESNNNNNNNNDNNNSTFTYNTINSNSYPLLNNITVEVNNLDYNNNNNNYIENYEDEEYDDDDEYDDYDQINENELKIERPNSNIYYTSDDSDFESDEESDSSFNNDNDENCCIAALQRLNFDSNLDDNDGNDNDNSNNDNNDNNDYDNDNYLHYHVKNIPLNDDDLSDENDSYSDLDSDDQIEYNSIANNETFANGFCGLIRMHSQQKVLNIENYVNSVVQEVKEEFQEELEEIKHEINEELNDSKENTQNEIKDLDSNNVEELPSLSNCSSLSSMEEIKLSNQNLTKLDLLIEDSKNTDILNDNQNNEQNILIV